MSLPAFPAVALGTAGQVSGVAVTLGAVACGGVMMRILQPQGVAGRAVPPGRHPGVAVSALSLDEVGRLMVAAGDVGAVALGAGGRVEGGGAGRHRGSGGGGGGVLQGQGRRRNRQPKQEQAAGEENPPDAADADEPNGVRWTWQAARTLPDAMKSSMARADVSVDAYIARQTPEAQSVLRSVRSIIRTVLPTAEETISYQIPTYKLHGQYVVYFAGWTHHWSVYPVTESIREALGPELAAYEFRKGTVRFRLADPVPRRLVRRIVKELAKAALARAERKTSTRSRPAEGRRRARGGS